MLFDGQGILRTAYAVCTLEGVVEASCLQSVTSAQVTKLIALTSVAHNLRVTIYTDSHCGFGVVHDFGQL